MIDINYISEEYIKCYQDKSRIYMITNYLKTFDGMKGLEVPFQLFPRQQELCRTLGYGTNSVCTTKYRQAGITTVTAAFISCQMVLSDKTSPKAALIIGNTLDLAQEMLFKIQNFLLQFPLWMWGPEYYEEGEDITQPPANGNVIWKKCNGKVIILKNGCKIYARSSGPNASRGISACHYLIFDETAFIENGKEVYTSALPTTSSVKGRAIFVSTPCGKDPLYYETCRRAKLKGTKDWNGFDLVEMFWYQDLRYNKRLEWERKNVETGEKEVFKEPVLDNDGTVPYDEEHWADMLKKGWKPTSPWYVKMCQQFNYDPQQIAQELDVSFLGSDSNVVAPEYIDMQTNKNVKDPDPHFLDPVITDTWIWKPPYEGHRYILSIDNSRGDSDDATAMEMIDIDGIDENGFPCIEQVLEYNGKFFGNEVAELANSYGRQYNNAFIVVESIGGYGDATLLALRDNYQYPNLYYDDPALKQYTAKNVEKRQQNGTEMPGFHTSSVRIQMLTNFANMVRNNEFKIRSKRVIAELDTWVWKNGRPDHKDGCHDDTLTCLAMGLFVFRFSILTGIQNRAKDETMLKAMISVNSNRIVYEEHRGDVNQVNKFSIPIYTEKSLGIPKENKYSRYMWLFK